MLLDITDSPAALSTTNRPCLSFGINVALISSSRQLDKNSQLLVLFLAIINRHLWWNEYAHPFIQLQSPLSFKSLFTQRNMHSWTSAVHFYMLTSLSIGCMIMHAYCKYCWVLPAPGWGNPYVMSITFLTLRGQGVVATSWGRMVAVHESGSHLVECLPFPA